MCKYLNSVAFQFSIRIYQWGGPSKPGGFEIGWFAVIYADVNLFNKNTGALVIGLMKLAARLSF